MSSRPLNPPSTPTDVPVEDRYPGTHPFRDTLVDQLRFFGRADESSLLFHRVIGSDLLVFFGKSGLGKTSLLNARLAPLLRDRDFLPLPVRFNQANRALTPMQVFATAVEEACCAQQIDYTPGTMSTLWEFLKTAIFWRGDRLQVPVLILDQFEEIFTLQSDHFRTATAIEIGQLISGRLPDHLRKQLLQGGRLPFGEKAPDVKILVALREDDLGMLQELAPQIPSILQSRFRLTPLNETDAESAIVRPAALAHPDIKFFTRPFTYEPQAVADIIAAARKKSDGIDPFVLQLICRHVERQVRDRQLRAKNDDAPVVIDSRFIGGSTGITALSTNFYDRAIKRLAGPKQRARAREMCEVGLISESGRRRSIDKEYLQRRFKVDDASLDSLVAGRLLQSEARHGTRYYEISHDLLAGAVRGRRRWRMPRGMKTGLAIAALAVVLLVWYQARKRHQAEVQRERAEKVLDVVIFDTWKRMSAIGEWPLLEKIQQELNHYYDDVGRFGESESILRRKSFAIDNEGDMHSRRGEYQEALNSYKSSLQIREQLLSKDPKNPDREDDIGLSFDKIGEALKSRGDLKAALDAHQRRLSIMEKLVELEPNRLEWQRRLATSCQKIGSVHYSRLEYATAEKFYSRRLTIMERLVQADGKNAEWQHDVADAYSDQSTIFFAKYDYAAALGSAEKFKQFQIKFAETDPADMQWQRGIALGDQKIGEIYFEQGFLAKALESLKACVGLLEKVTARDPGNTEWQTDLGSAYLEMGAIQSALLTLDDAKASYREDLKIIDKLLARDPTNMAWQNHMAFIQQAKGDVEFKQKDFAGALKSFETCLKIRQDLFDRGPNNARQQFVADTFGRIGDAQFSLNDTAGATKSYEKSIELFTELLKRDEENRDWQRELSVMYGRLASVYTGDASLDLLRKQLAIAKKLSTADPNVVSWAVDLAVILYDLGHNLEQTDDAGRVEALANYREAIRILGPLAEQDRLEPDAKKFLVDCEQAAKKLEKPKR